MTMTTSETLDLDPIEAHAAELRTRLDRKNPWPCDNEAYWQSTGWRAGTRNALDKLHPEAMAAEIHRLRDRVAELERLTAPRTPRLCKCGHSHYAHTVPAPHSCFAYGQTCPCEAYQQLPHEEAVAQLKRNQQAADERAAAEEAHVVADDSDDPETGTRPCGYGAPHDGHEWTSRPDIWCPGS
jgi:hypothetical protein